MDVSDSSVSASEDSAQGPPPGTLLSIAGVAGCAAAIFGALCCCGLPGAIAYILGDSRELTAEVPDDTECEYDFA